ncbi:MAG: YbaN family protein [Pseudomonadota bacterium]|nr:YbaN family protein [Pseudomonadota bacterium]
MQERPNEETGQGKQKESSTRLHNSRLVRALYLTVGFAALILGVVGIMVPVLPTTPFVLLAAACFARSSERFHDKLLANRIAGPIIREWTEHRSIPRRVKRWVYLLMVLSFGSSILLLTSVWHQAMLAALGITLVAFIWRIPVRDADQPIIHP